MSAWSVRVETDPWEPAIRRPRRDPCRDSRRAVVSAVAHPVERFRDPARRGGVAEAEVAVAGRGVEVDAGRAGHPGVVEQVAGQHGGESSAEVGRSRRTRRTRPGARPAPPKPRRAQAGRPAGRGGAGTPGGVARRAPTRRAGSRPRRRPGPRRGPRCRRSGRAGDGVEGPLGAHEPAEPPARHAERLREAVDHERVGGVGEHGGGRGVVHELAVDLVDVERAVARRHLVGDGASSAGGTVVPVGLDGVASSTPLVRSVHAAPMSASGRAGSRSRRRRARRRRRRRTGGRSCRLHGYVGSPSTTSRPGPRWRRGPAPARRWRRW